MIRTSGDAPKMEQRELVVGAPGTPSHQAITIRVDNTGVASWKYRNARNPPRIWDRKDPVPEQFRLKFLNATSGATVKVTLPQVAVPFVPNANPQNALNPASLLGLDLAGARAEAQRLVNLEYKFTDEASAFEPDEGGNLEIDCLVRYLKQEVRDNDQKLTALIEEDVNGAAQERTPDAKAAMSKSPNLLSVDLNALRILKLPAAEPSDPGSPQARISAACALVTRPDASAADARASLNWFRKHNPGRAGARTAVAIAAGIDALEQAAAAIGEYAARVKADNAPASGPGAPPKEAETTMARAERLFGVKLDACETKNGEVLCVPTLTLAPNAEGFIEGRLLVKYPAKGVIKFRVTFPFALESEQPSDQFGYFSLDAELQQSPTVATWTATGTLSFVRDPYYGADGTVIDADHHYDGARARQFRGTARAALNYALGDRATGTIEMQFKNSMLGRKDEDLAVKVNQYNFQVFGFTGTSLKFGKYLFAAPTDGLAINETGEGATARFRWVGVSHILKREGVAGAADPNDDDHKVWLADVSNVAVPGWSSLRSLSFYGLYGIDNTPDRERRYDTFGGEALFGVPKVLLTGTVAYYHSRSRPHHGSPVRRADGSTWLTRASKSWFDGSKPARTVGVTVAGGTGDRRETTDRYEGYLGENAAYSPDGSVFVSGVVPRLRVEPVPFVIVDKTGAPVLDKDKRTTPEFIEKGLSNRRFVGVTFSDQTVSPLEWLAQILRIPQKDVESQQSTFRLHYYSPTEQVLGTRTGSWEAQVEFLLESPKGVKYIVKYSRVFAGGPLEPFFPKEPYTLLAQCSISLK